MRPTNYNGYTKVQISKYADKSTLYDEVIKIQVKEKDGEKRGEEREREREREGERQTDMQTDRHR